ncbi:MAG: rod shape-determining protein MreC [Caldisericia bacterium]|nr:rod shape-determining protein MreC [Caldisericia bacterium]
MIPKKTNRFLLIVICLAFLLGTGVFWRYNNSKFSKYSRSSSRSFVVPVSGFVSRTGNNLREFLTNLFSYPELQHKYIELKNENEKLIAEITIRENIMEENQRLKSMLRIYQDNPETYLPCSIIFRNPDNPNNFIINAGSNQNIEENKAVVYPIFQSNGIQHFQLIGRTTKIGYNESEIMSILDDKSNISIKNIRNNEVGTLSFDSEKNILYIKFHINNAFKEGDIVVVSSLSSLPNDLVVGSVQRVTPTESIYYHATIATTINSDVISEVMVLK